MNTNTTRAFTALVTTAALCSPVAVLANTTTTTPTKAASTTVSATAVTQKTPRLAWALLIPAFIVIGAAISPRGTMSKQTTPPPYDD